MSFSTIRTSLIQLLDAERADPSVQYQASMPFVNEAAFSASPLGQRGWHPRPVSEMPGHFKLQSRNYDLLEHLFAETPATEHAAFFQILQARLKEPNPFVVQGENLLGVGETQRTQTELLLIAEFLVKHGQEKSLISGLRQAPLRPALTRLLLHVEEMIALDYRVFTDEGYDELIPTVKVLEAGFAELKKGPKIHDTRESNYRFHVVREGDVLCKSLLVQAPRAKYLRFSQQAALKAAGKLEGIEALRPNEDDENFHLLAQQVRAAIENGSPSLGLDRLHTFMVRYIRNVYTKHFGTAPNENSTLNALLGQVANDLRSKGTIKSGMASEILKNSTRVLEKFNQVRNAQTFAHDNADLLDDEEARFIYQSVAACVRYLETLGY